MTHKQGQDLQGSYMDGIAVKISEHYKPPPRISLPITYAQRLSLNKQIQDNIPNYNFILETNVKEQIGALKNARNCITQRSQKRCELIKEERQRREELRQTEIEVKEQEVLNSEIINTSTVTQTISNSLFIAPETSQPYTSNSGILVPTQVSSYSNILTPIPLKYSVTASGNFNCNPTDRSPFNISDFEADTSSPFDNMELKTLNDMEELAQVLQKDEPMYTTASQMYPMYSPVQTVTSNSHSEYTNYLRSDGGSGITQTSNMYAIPPKMPQYNQQIYSRSNGYHLSPGSVPFTNKAANVSYPFTSFTSDNTIQNTKYNAKSVPDIMKALETELENHHINNSEHSMYVKTHSVIQRKCSTPIVLKTKDDLDDPYGTLSKNLQDLCTQVSSMGFPLPRVARACKILGDDHKKVTH